MTGPQDEVLYVGKSVRVKSRLLSYFRAEPREKAGKLIKNTVGISWEYVPNEFVALVKELRLIKRFMPRYNSEHKRRRRFAFIKVTRERAPRVLPVGRILPDGATYFGPFPRPKHLALTLRELCQTLRIRDCPGTVPIIFGDQLEIFQGGHTPRCLRAETGSCLGPCCGGCTMGEYSREVELARRFLEGRSKEPLRLLREEMEEASEALEYEYAALVRDRLDRLEALQKELVAFRGRVAGLSFVYRVPGFKGNERLYLIREGLVEEDIPRPRGEAGRRKAAQTIEEVFSRPRREMRELTPEAAAEILLVARWFRLKKGELKRTASPKEWLRAHQPEAA
jgi:excinuclease ABC subunit C